jgi:hypothetical protein
MFTACSVYPNLRHVRFCSLAFQKITRASGVNFRALFTHPQTKTSRVEHGTHASESPPKSPQNYGYVEHGEVCSLL